MEALAIYARLPPSQKSILSRVNTRRMRLNWCLAISLACCALLFSKPVENSLYEPLLISHADVQCLAVTMEKEALAEGKHGMRLVANVVIQRMLMSGDSLCNVVKKPRQFSWAAKTKRWVAKLKDTEAHAREILVNFALGRHVDKIKATHFVTHEAYEKIDWKLPVVLRYKNHVFMKEK